MPEQPLVTDDLAVTYTGTREVEALKGVTIEFHENELTTIIGPSGCGKSTLMKALNRLHEIQSNVEVSGNVYLNNEPIYGTERPLPEIRRQVGYVPQTPTAFPLSVYNNVAYGPQIHGAYTDDELDDLVETYLKKVNLWTEVNDRLSEPAADLSTGQLQRLCLARSLAVEPDILLCDEVTSALDPVSAQSVEETLTDLTTEYTIVMITHSMNQARRLADKVVFLYLGELVEASDVDSFFNNPTRKRTKQFISGQGAVIGGGGETG